MAGIIAAGDNDFGTVGVAPNIQLLIVKVTDPGLPITPQAAACAFKYVSQQNVDVANASFAVDKGATGSADPLDFFCASDPADAAAIQLVGGAVKSALRSGTTIVASAGNNGVDMTQPAAGSSCVRMPVQLPGVIGVASEGRNGGPVLATPPGPSNFGFGAIDLVAPGGDPRRAECPGGLILSTFPSYIPIPPTAMPNVVDGPPGATYRYNAGTSMAAADVSGVAALVASRFAKLKAFGFLKPLKPLFIRAVLDQTAQAKPCPPDPRCVGTRPVQRVLRLRPGRRLRGRDRVRLRRLVETRHLLTHSIAKGRETGPSSTQGPKAGSSSARSNAARSCTGSPCDTITCSKGRSSRALSAGSVRSSCQGVPQTRSSPSRSVSASAKTSARRSGAQSGVSFRPRPS